MQYAIHFSQTILFQLKSSITFYMAKRLLHVLAINFIDDKRINEISLTFFFFQTLYFN